MKKYLILSLTLLLAGCLQTTLGFEPPAGPAPAQPAIPTSAPTQTAIPPSLAASPQCATVKADSLHIRYQPSEHAQAIGWVSGGTPVKIITTETGSIIWWKVSATGIDDQGRQASMTGYVNAVYLNLTECEP